MLVYILKQYLGILIAYSKMGIICLKLVKNLEEFFE